MRRKGQARLLVVVVAMTILTIGCLWLYFQDETVGTGIPCPIRLLTHLYCPGCGSGRAVIALLHGNLGVAFRQNPALIILLPFLIIYGVVRTVEFILGRESRIDKWISPKLLLGVLVLLFLYGILRNLPIAYFDLLRPYE